MNDFEALQILIKITELRLSGEYQAAEALRQRSGAETMARARPDSNEHAAVWRLIGTWDRIATFVRDFDDRQRRRFFRSTPVGLVWRYLEPGVRHMRQSADIGASFATELEALAVEYQKWTETQDGQEFRTQARQAVTALFA
jgi:hypothetical protein